MAIFVVMAAPRLVSEGHSQWRDVRCAHEKLEASAAQLVLRPQRELTPMEKRKNKLFSKRRKAR